jgi:hypothetical protein
MKAIKKDGYLYDPPSWKVCDECGGRGKITIQIPCPDGIEGCLVAHFRKVKCPKCADSSKPGYLPIPYTPEEWKSAGGILTDDTPCWQIIKQGNETLRFMEPWGDLKKLREGEIYIATSTGPVKEVSGD